jgi:hypothetical protein
MKTSAISFRFRKQLGLACLLAAFTSAAAAGAEPKSLFDETAAANAIAKLTEKMKAPVRALVIEIKPTSLTLQVQDPAAPTHINEYKYARRVGVLGLLGDAAVSGPEPVKLSLINPRLEENLFTLTDVNFAGVSETIREALKRVKVEGGTVEGVTIRRQLLLNASGPVEWSIYVRSPRESATAYADGAGNIHRLDLGGTTRATMLDLTQGGAMLAEAIAVIREQFGASPIFKKFSVSTRSVDFSIRDPQNPAQATGYYYNINGIQKPPSLDIVHTIDKVVEGELFSVEDVDWARMPELKKLAVEQVAIPGGFVQHIHIIRPRTAVGHKPPHWKFTVGAGPKESGTAEFDAKTGALARVVPPESRRKKINHLEPEMVSRMLATARAELGADIAFLTIFVQDGGGTMSVHTSDRPDEIRRYGFDDLNGLHFLETTRDSRLKDPPETWRTPLAEIEAALPMLPALYQKARDRLQLPQGVIQRLTLNRSDVFYPNNKKAILEIRVEVPGDSGRVVYDLKGAEFDAVTPDSYKSEDKTEPTLKTLDMTDATPARVKKFETHFAALLALTKKYSETRWHKQKVSEPAELSTLSREELSKYRKVQSDILHRVDRILEIFGERSPPSDAIATSKVNPPARRREYWEAQHAAWEASNQQANILDENWGEWVAEGIPEDESQHKTWQKEFTRLEGVMDAAGKRIKELSPPKE